MWVFTASIPKQKHTNATTNKQLLKWKEFKRRWLSLSTVIKFTS